MADYILDQGMTEEVEKKFSKMLRHKEQIKMILLHSEEKREYFEELIFTSKYLMGVLRASVKKEFSGNDVLNKEIIESIYKMKVILKIILGERYSSFDTAYFNTDTTSFINLTGLASDLEMIKLYLNDLKRES